MSDSDATRKKPPGTPPADPHKAALELRKLELEIKALTFKQSRLGRLTEILQGVVPILAILSLVWTVVVGLNQQEAQRKDAESARFERAFAKLGSSVPSERVTGVAQASALLHAAGGRARQGYFDGACESACAGPEPGRSKCDIECSFHHGRVSRPAHIGCHVEEHRGPSSGACAIGRVYVFRTFHRTKGQPRHLLHSACKRRHTVGSTNGRRDVRAA